MKKQKVAASLTVYGVGDMTAKGRYEPKKGKQ